MDTEYEFAPLEGVTDAVYRRTHRRFYPGLTRYYTPFISPTKNHIFTPRDIRELSRENNPDVPLVPQLIGKNAKDLLWAMHALADMGYAEVNLNFGCPSGTVTAKGKGAGALTDTEALDRLLDTVFSAILDVYDRYPVCRLVIHPRTAAEMYGGSAHRDAFARAAAKTDLPLSYNGDLFTKADLDAFQNEFPHIKCVMLGRGLVSDPGMLAGGGKKTLADFHDALCGQYPVVFGSANSAMHRMKAIWAYMIGGFPDSAKWHKRIIKARSWDDFLALTREILTQYPD